MEESKNIKRQFCMLLPYCDYQLSSNVFIPRNAKRKRFAFRKENGVFQIEYNKAWYEVNELDFLKD